MSSVAGCLHFEYSELCDATGNFSTSYLLGEGGFGPVYKGELKFTEVAIKKLRDTSKDDTETASLAAEQFAAEVKFLTSFRHPNLVTLMGYSLCGGWKCLIYEYLPNGTLEDALLRGYKKLKNNATQRDIYLPWMCRMSISLDTARGLSYLHTADRKRPLVHRDVKSANVLLDLSFRAKVGDFGLARPLHDRDLKTEHIMGTSGYIPPEYYRGVITTKMDTFGYGVILLEMISGQPSYVEAREQKDLISFMEKDMDKNDASILCTKVDPNAGDWPSSAFVELFRIAKKCVEPKLVHRSEIAEVYPDLEKIITRSAEDFSEQLRYTNKTSI